MLYYQQQNFVPDWFLTSKMLENFDNHVFSNGVIECFDVLTFFSNDMSLNIIL